MNKKLYMSPQTKVTKVLQTQIICTSGVTSNTPNEQYVEVDVSEEGWY